MQAHAYMQTHTHTYTHTCAHTNKYTRTRTHVHTCANRLPSCVHVHVRVPTEARRQPDCAAARRRAGRPAGHGPPQAQDPGDRHQHTRAPAAPAGVRAHTPLPACRAVPCHPALRGCAACCAVPCRIDLQGTAWQAPPCCAGASCAHHFGTAGASCVGASCAHHFSAAGASCAHHFGTALLCGCKAVPHHSHAPLPCCPLVQTTSLACCLRTPLIRPLGRPILDSSKILRLPFCLDHVPGRLQTQINACALCLSGLPGQLQTQMPVLAA